jgi:hypothetical protein
VNRNVLVEAKKATKKLLSFKLLLFLFAHSIKKQQPLVEEKRVSRK